MPKMTIRVILKSGSEFAIKCDKFTIKQNGFGQATGYNIEGITENKPVYLDFEQVAAVVRLYSDEHTEDTQETEKKRGATETKTKCPHCDGDVESAIIYADEENKEYFVYCPICGIETVETYASKAKALKAFADGKTKPISGKGAGGGE